MFMIAEYVFKSNFTYLSQFFETFVSVLLYHIHSNK